MPVPAKPRIAIEFERKPVALVSDLWIRYEPGPTGSVRIDGDWEEVQVYIAAIQDLYRSRKTP